MEFAILALPFSLLLISVLEFGRLQWTRNAVEQVAAAGARCVGLRAVACSDAGTPRVYNAQKTQSYMSGKAANWSVLVPNSNIAVSTAATCQGVANFVQVTVNYQFSSGILSIAGLSNFPISAVACYPNQN